MLLLAFSANFFISPGYGYNNDCPTDWLAIDLI